MKHRIIHRLLAIAAAAIVAAACNRGAEPVASVERDRVLDQAFALVDNDPARAAIFFADAGPGPSLETSRLATWANCLERSAAGADAWRRYLEEDPPTPLALRARLALIQALIDHASFEAAIAERSSLPAGAQLDIDELLFAVDEPEARLDAAQRLVVGRPAFLDAADRTLDRKLASNLEPEDLLERAAAWSRAGRPSRAAAELRARRWSGEREQWRRRQLARAELESGSPTRALNVLPSTASAEAEDQVVRAQALRNRGWHLFPDRSATRVFRDCVAATDSALALGGTFEDRQAALALRLECATQTGQLAAAFESWRLLEAVAWDDHRREWLGRRLGVALTRVAGQTQAVEEIARGLPSQRRCLRFWMAIDSADGEIELVELADAGVADLYGRWSRQILDRSLTEQTRFGPAIAAGEPPRSVTRLLAAGLKTEALREWQRIRRARPPTPAEALAAADLAARHGWSSASIRWLLSAFPELGTIDMTEVAENAVRAYLPLRWSEAVTAAANETGLEPWLIAGVARQESGFVAHARSPRGAVGVLQLLPSTARLHARALGLGDQSDLQDPELNIRLGAHELSALMRRFGAVEPALAAYNGGLTRVRGWWKQWPERRRFTEEIPVPETYNYVRRVVYLSEAYRLVYDQEWRRSQ